MAKITNLFSVRLLLVSLTLKDKEANNARICEDMQMISALAC
jgi:hypothetical protein